MQAHPAGVPFDLVILFKGFHRNSSEHDELLAGTPHRRLFVSDRGYDIDAYFEAAKRLDDARFCFLNSYSRILADGWLEKLLRWSLARDVGLAGATGSFQSIAGGYTAQDRQLRALPPLTRFWTRVGRALRDRRPKANAERTMRVLLRLAGQWSPARDFPAFPNPHLRTNAFIASREVLNRVNPGPLRLKLSAYKFESGRDSLTARVRRMGLQVLVVGRDGEAYEPERWHLSNTFWQSREENLLVADNQTELYLAGDAAKRAELAQYAWGENARPG